MKFTQTILVVVTALGLALGITACGEDEVTGAVECGTDLHLTVGDISCDLAPGEVECFVGMEQDEGTEMEVVGCAGENSTCGFELELVFVGGEIYYGVVGIADAEENEMEGEIGFDTVDYSKGDTILNLSFDGEIVPTDFDIGVVGCFVEVPWSEGNLDDEESDCHSYGPDGHFYCEDITDEDVCSYVVGLCEEDEMDLESCCQWDEEAGNCGAAAEDLPCDMITEQEVCDTVSEECYWDDGN